MPAPDALEAPQPANLSSSRRDALLYRPASWFEPLDLVAMFGRDCPLEVELGSGDGSFLVRWAGLHPARNFLGVERLLGRIRKLDRKAQRAGLANVRGLRIEASYAIEYLLPPASVEVLHLYFPDPWPKRRHHKHRLVNDRFVSLAARVLSPAGKVHLRTDNPDYFAQMRQVFGVSASFKEFRPPAELTSVLTDFEEEFNRAGTSTLRTSYVTRR
jgi:tRNA (guanine-N7-)-methyltransferase